MILLNLLLETWIAVLIGVLAASVLWYRTAQAWARRARQWRNSYLASEAVRTLDRRRHAEEIARWQAGGPYR